MNGIGLGILIVICVVAAIWLYKLFKPYFIKYDTTLCVNGGLGSGKTLTCVKTAVVLIRRQRFFKYTCYNFFSKIINYFIKKSNDKKSKQNLENAKNPNYKIKQLKPLRKLRAKPHLYSNIPIHYKTHIFGSSREWSKKLQAPNLLCLKEIVEYSVVFIDELPQFINQFNWNEQLVQDNVNEFITFFRHYIGGYLIVNAQACEDVVVQIRRKLNQAIWCFDFKKHLFGLFYTIRMCDIMLGEQVGTISTTFIEENTKLHFGLFPPKGTYDTRCYSERMKNIYQDAKGTEKWKHLKTNQVLRLVKYTSPLDDTTTQQQKQQQWEKGEKIWKN